MGLSLCSAFGSWRSMSSIWDSGQTWRVQILSHGQESRHTLFPLPVNIPKGWCERLKRGMVFGFYLNSHYYSHRRPLTSTFHILNRLRGCAPRLLSMASHFICIHYLIWYQKYGMSAWAEVWASSCPPISTFPVTGGCGWTILGTSANDGIKTSEIEHKLQHKRQSTA